MDQNVSPLPLGRLLQESFESILEHGCRREVGRPIGMESGNPAPLVFDAKAENIVVWLADQGILDSVIEIEGGAEEDITSGLRDYLPEGVEILRLGPG